MKNDVKHIAFMVIPDVTLLDITGPYEVFAQAQECLKNNGRRRSVEYILHSVSVGCNKNVKTASGMILHCPENINNIDYEIDTLFIPGVPNSQVEEYRIGKNVLKWIGEYAAKVHRICSVCTGTFFLAEAGVIQNKNVTTHWAKCEVLQKNYPDIKVDDNPIFVKDGNIYTSAGISSGMDLALALIEEDMGKTFALEVAKQMVLYLKRPGSQSQYSSVLTHQSTDYRPIQELVEWMMENLHESLTVELLAERISMSPRNFARVFVREMGITPARYIDKLRVDAACRYLVDTALSQKEIAVLCGLGSVDNMRKVFYKYLDISPADYRQNFGTAFMKKER
jgi:Transcriptional regulator containing an amidase domain and an AraC-type DNA-binding HTH domain